MVQSIRALIVDDQPRARQSLRALLATCPQIGGMSEAANGLEALRCVEECRPDVVLMDVRMPDMDGLEATRRIKAQWQGVKVIMLSMYGEYAEESRAAGADAFVTKGEPAERLLATISAVTGHIEACGN